MFYLCIVCQKNVIKYFITTIVLGSLALSCYECDDCKSEHPAYLNEKVKECPDSSYVSCLKTESKFAHYTSKYFVKE